MGVLRALLLAVALSVVDAVRRSATPHDAVLGWVERLDRQPMSGSPDGHNRSWGAQSTVSMIAFFANANYVKGRIREASQAHRPGTVAGFRR